MADDFRHFAKPIASWIHLILRAEPKAVVRLCSGRESGAKGLSGIGRFMLLLNTSVYRRDFRNSNPRRCEGAGCVVGRR